MAVAVVKNFKMINVEHQQRKRFPISARPLGLLTQSLLKLPMVVETGEAIGGRPSFHFLQKAGIAQGHGGVDAEGRQEILVLG